MSDKKEYGFTIDIFFPNNTPDGLRIVEKSNWTGRGIVCPRAKFIEYKSRLEFAKAGVYILVGPSPDGDLPIIYVGEGDPIRPRLEDHYANKDFWTLLISFISKDDNLNKTHVQYLEARLVALIREAKRSVLDNLNIPQLPSISERDEHWMERFLEEMLLIYPVLGISVFEKPYAAPPATQILELNAKGIRARGYDTGQGFVVLKGSQAVLERDVAASTHQFMKDMRQSLMDSGIFAQDQDALVMTQDYTFTSPTTAAGVLLGKSVNGRDEWKDSQGRSLKNIQAQAVGAST